MFDSIKTLILVNVQSHEQTILNFERNGVHRISGNNSHGKSVVMKALYTLLMGENLDKPGRQSMVNWYKEFCIISAESYNGVMLTLFLHLESSKSFYELDYKGNKIRKSLADDYKTLLKVANFHYLPEEKFSINRYKTKTTLPFTHTSGTLNYRILDSASEVPQAKEVMEVVDEKLKEIKLDRENVERKLISLTEQIRTMDDSGIYELETRITYVDKLYSNYQKLKPITEITKSIVEGIKGIESIRINDFKESENVLVNLKILQEVKYSLTEVEKTNGMLYELDKNSNKEPVDISGIISQLKVIRNSKNIVEDLVAMLNRLNKFKDAGVINLDVILNNAKLVSQINKTIKVIGSSEKHLNEINLIEKPIDISKLIENNKTINKISSNLYEGDRLSREIVDINLHLLNLNNDINSLIKDIGICKHCGNTLTENHHHNIV